MNYIREYRMAAHLTLKELGDKIGVSKDAIWTYEKGRSEPSYENLLKIAEVLDTTVDNLMRGEVAHPNLQLFSSSATSTEIARRIEKLDEAQRRQLLKMIEVMFP